VGALPRSASSINRSAELARHDAKGELFDELLKVRSYDLYRCDATPRSGI